MTSDFFTERPLFGGAISSTFPSRFQVSRFSAIWGCNTCRFNFLSNFGISGCRITFGYPKLQDVSNVRQVPDHQVGYA
jgi:hypothetical protein